MQSLKALIKKENLHHAYLLQGEPQLAHDILFPFLKEELGIEVRGNFDVYHRDYDSFGIDDARFLRNWTARKTSEGGRMLAIISCFSMTHEAQNALLKLFEEPTEGTHFFIITPNTASLLPTLRSRLMEVPLLDLEEGSLVRGDSLLAEEFLNKTAKERIELLGEIIENKDKVQAASFLRELEVSLHKKTNMESAEENTLFALKEIAQGRSYLSDRSPSVKMILEHISLITPRIPS